MSFHLFPEVLIRCFYHCVYSISFFIFVESKIETRRDIGTITHIPNSSDARVQWDTEENTEKLCNEVYKQNDLLLLDNTQTGIIINLK